MLELVFGGSGCGKTYYSRHAAASAALAGEHPVLIVPEQFSFESERAMLELLGAEHVGLCDVFSFSRLAEIMEENTASLPRLDACGRAAAMCAALSELGDHLELYRGKRSSSFVDHMLDAVKEFKLYSITPEILSGAAVQTDGTLSRKLRELSLVSAAYDSIIAQCAADPLDDLSRLSKQLDSNRYFDGRTVIIDSFRSFTGQQLEVLRRIIAQSARCMVTICAERCDRDEKDGLFAIPLRTAERLRELAHGCGAGEAAPVYLTKRYRFESDALAALEESFFRFPDEQLVFSEPTDDVTIYQASDRWDEAEYCARECRRLMREDGCRCRDIAVIVRSDSSYRDAVADAMEQQDIPCFIDTRINASCGALMQLVSAALDAAVNGLNVDRVMRLLKTGLVSGAPVEAVSELENYCFILGIKPAELRRPFTDPAESLDNARSAQALADVEALRLRVVSLIDTLADGLREASGKDMARALYDFLISCGADVELDRLASGMTVSLAAEQQQLWSAMMALLDQIAMIIGDRRISPADFAELIGIMIDRCDIGHIPRGLDEVTFGAADRIRVTAPKALFVLGMLDGEFPAAPTGSGVFTDDERKRLLELDINVADTAEMQLLDERLLVYTTLSAASRRLYVTYPARTQNGEFPSECITEIMSIIPYAAQRFHSDELSINDIEGINASFELAARSWHASSAPSAALRDVLARREDYAPRMAMLEEENSEKLPELSSPSDTRALFGGRLYLSSTKIDTFFSCRFKYLCKYGLRLNPRRKLQLDSLGYGTATHYVLENIFRENADRPMAVLSDMDTVRTLVAGLLEQFIEDNKDSFSERRPVTLYRIRRMKPMLAYLVVNIASELASSDFKPLYFEAPVAADDNGGQITLHADDGTEITMSGIIDRVDCCDMNGHRYIRVIDYKTGEKCFRLSELLNGLNMQLLIYLGCLSQKYPDDIPAGILYCPALPPGINGIRGMSDYDIIAAQRSRLRRDGLIIDETETLDIADAMENGLEARYIPVHIGRSGLPDDFSARHIISPTAYGTIRRYVRYKIMQMAGELSSGSMSPSPCESDFEQCRACEYYPVCRYTGSASKPFSYDNDTAIEMMEEEMNTGKGGDS